MFPHVTLPFHIFSTFSHIFSHHLPYDFSSISPCFPMFSSFSPCFFHFPRWNLSVPSPPRPPGPNQGLMMAAADDSSEAAAGAELWRLVPRLERRRRAKKAPVACGVAPPKTVRKWAQNRWQWFGLVGKIYTGNPWVFTMRYGGFRFQFSLKPIHWPMAFFRCFFDFFFLLWDINGCLCQQGGNRTRCFIVFCCGGLGWGGGGWDGRC